MNIVLGIGSPFSDDQVGWLVARYLSASIGDCCSKIIEEKLVVEEVNRPGLNLLRWVESDYTNLVLIDMVRTNENKPGSIYMLKSNEILGFSGMLSSHSLGIANSLGLAHVLGIDMSKIIFWGVEGCMPDLKDNVSPEVLNAVPKVAQQIIDYLKRN